MAVSKNNVITRGASGMLGGMLVFRTLNGKTIISNRPKKPTRESPIQKANRTKFRRATLFAKQMMADPVKKAEYWEIAKKLQLPNAYTAAITEFMRKAEINNIDTSGISEELEGEIRMTVKKRDFEVERVDVFILHNNGIQIQNGTARKDLDDVWIYDIKTKEMKKKNLQILIRTKERTGNIVEKRILFQ